MNTYILMIRWWQSEKTNEKEEEDQKKEQFAQTKKKPTEKASNIHAARSHRYQWRKVFYLSVFIIGIKPANKIVYCVNSEFFFLFPFLSLLTRNVRAEFPWWLAIDWADCSSKFQRWIKKAKQKKKKIPRITKKNGPFHNIKSRNFIWNHTIWIYIFWNASNFLSVEFDGKTLKKMKRWHFILPHICRAYSSIRLWPIWADNCRTDERIFLSDFFSIMVFCSFFFALNTQFFFFFSRQM